MLKAVANIPKGNAPIPKDIWKPPSPNPNPWNPWVEEMQLRCRTSRSLLHLLITSHYMWYPPLLPTLCRLFRWRGEGDIFFYLDPKAEESGRPSSLQGIPAKTWMPERSGSTPSKTLCWSKPGFLELQPLSQSATLACKFVYMLYNSKIGDNPYAQ